MRSICRTRRWALRRAAGRQSRSAGHGSDGRSKWPHARRTESRFDGRVRDAPQRQHGNDHPGRRRRLQRWIPPSSPALPVSARTLLRSTGGSRAISSVDFRRTRDGGGRVVVNLTDPSTPVDIRQEGGRVVAVFKDTGLPAELMRRLDVMDFATPVTTVDTLRTNLDTRIVISAEGKYEQLAYQSDNEFTIEINPAVAKMPRAGSNLFSETKEYEGQRLTLNFQDIETRAVLQLLAETSGENIVVSDTVQGNVTLRLRNVPWDQALDIVMTTKGLDMRQNGNVIIVAPAEEIAARETADLEAKLAISELEPLYSEFLQVNYAKAGDLAALISGQAVAATRCCRSAAVLASTIAPTRCWCRIQPSACRTFAAWFDARYPDQAGADRVAHRCRQR